MSRILRKTTEQGTIKKVKNQLRSESKWMMRKEKTKSTKYRTYPFCQKAPPNAVLCCGTSLCPRSQQDLLQEEGSPGHSLDSKSKWRKLRAKPRHLQAKTFTDVNFTHCK